MQRGYLPHFTAFSSNDCFHIKSEFPIIEKDFTLLTLRWSDRYIFISTGFNMLSFVEKSNCYQELSDTIDHRTNGYRALKESVMKILLGIDAIGMIKQLKQYYIYQGRQYTLHELEKFVSLVSLTYSDHL